MLRRIALCVALGTMPLGIAACNRGSAVDQPTSGTAPEAAAGNVEIGNLLYTSAVPPLPAVPAGPMTAVDPIVVGGCHLVAFERQDVPCEKEGIIESIEVKEGDIVQPDQILARFRDNIPRDDVGMAEAKLRSAKAAAKAAEGTRDEAKARFDREAQLQARGNTSMQDYEAMKYAYVRFKNEAESKAEEANLAEQELNKAQTTLKMYEIRSAIPGVIKTIYKKKGEAVKSAPSYEPIFQIVNLSRLRAEGAVEKQYLALAQGQGQGPRGSG